MFISVFEEERPKDARKDRSGATAICVLIADRKIYCVHFYIFGINGMDTQTKKLIEGTLTFFFLIF
jgi:hypothetical protein